MRLIAIGPLNDDHIGPFINGPEPIPEVKSFLFTSVISASRVHVSSFTNNDFTHACLLCLARSAGFARSSDTCEPRSKTGYPTPHHSTNRVYCLDCRLTAEDRMVSFICPSLIVCLTISQGCFRYVWPTVECSVTKTWIVVPPAASKQTADLLLGWLDSTSEHLQLGTSFSRKFHLLLLTLIADKPLATDVLLVDGEVTITVPDYPERDFYIVCCKSMRTCHILQLTHFISVRKQRKHQSPVYD